MSASAGWYADPQDPQLLRYFDGASWTTHTQPAPGAQPAPTQSTPSAPAQPKPATAPGQASWTPQAQQPAHQPAQQGQFQQGQYQQGQFKGQLQGQASQGQPSWQQGPSALANQFTAQPRQPGRGNGPSTDGSSSGTPTAAKLWIVGSIVAIAVFMGIGLALDAGREPAPDELSDALAEALGRKSFDCDALGEEAIALSAEDSPEEQLVSVSGLTMTKDRRNVVELPETGEATALSCTGDGEWGDGFSGPLVLELVLHPTGIASVAYQVG